MSINKMNNGMISFIQDKRALRKGYETVYVNPEHVSAVVGNDSMWDDDNRSVIILCTGDKIVVKDYPDSVRKKLEGNLKE